MFWQKKAFGAFSVNERTMVQDNNNKNIILGIGGILSRYDYFNNTAGMHQDQYCDAYSAVALYWWDEDN